MEGKILSINISKKKGCRKYPVESAVITDMGIDGDAHAGPGVKQISLLTLKSIEKMRKKGYKIEYGELAENLTIDGIKPDEIRIGMRIRIGKNAIIEVTKIGKECHEECELFKGKIEDCMMAKEGFFARVIRGGEIKVGDAVSII